MAYEPPLTHKNRKYMSKRCAGFRHFGEVNYSYPRRVVHCDHRWCQRSRSHSWPSVQSMHLLLWCVIEWKHFPRYWPFVWGIHRSPVNSPHKGQWRGALMFSLICAWINGWVNNRKAGDLRRYRAHYDVTVMFVSRQLEQPFMRYGQ